MQISVVVPVHNEQENIESLIAEIAAALQPLYTFEMIFVDDGSSDATLAKLKTAALKYPQLRILHHQVCCGQSRAIHTGVSAAQYSWIATLDGDGQNDPADICKLAEEQQQHENSESLWMLAGFRHKRNDNGWRKFSSRFANSIRQKILQDNTPDTGCGLKLFLRDKFLQLPYFDHIHRFLPAMILATGGQVISVKVNHRPRNHGQSKYGTLDRLMAGIIDLLGVVWLKKRSSLPKITEVTRG
ncbi:dolichol-phosphate mannosyltransferase [Methyloprofundus sedimenti]|uniref:Dolichol-phosphate mannosyltransferase n=1 Tax=Methyloprofundus sedimenti TaxID=1420851 RepID=A0A1V8M3E6_9GAMM|nr:glycosyltransferase family 2 protein [Methyloprofundus sedimenti]OQK15923.1 dolichol-phosphate mannosyltransferase [Methyloprofundus sedimenti]